MGEPEPDLRFAGFAVGGRPATAAEYWDEFVRAIERVLASL
jgi:hypothetical protein